MLKSRLIVILGPTASGKTDYAIRLARENQAEVISADSRQVYRGMDIGSAKPRDAWLAAAHSLHSPEIVSGIPHYLLNIREPNEPMTLAEWQAAAFQTIDDIVARGRQPIMAGGTMLYIDSVVYNFEIPRVKPDWALRERKMKNEKRKIYEELIQKDPEAKNFIEPGNVRRIIRALEVIEATGRPFSLQQVQGKRKYEVEMIGLFPSWEELKRRIENRARSMFAEGLLEETKELMEKYPPHQIPHGVWNWSLTQHYRQAGAVLDGTMSEAEAVASMVQDNMRYAHRQMSWWKGREEIRWI